MNTVETWIPRVVSIAKEAAAAILDVYQQKAYQINSKLDNSPVTEADLFSDAIIRQGLKAIDANIPIISEEGEIPPWEVRSQWTKFWLVDPLDGTREFIKGTGEFSINIALIENHIPVLGVILAPYRKEIYWATCGQSAYFQKEGELPHIIQACAVRAFPSRVTISRSFHSESRWHALKERIGPHELLYCGSALKIALVAKGDADLYPRLGGTGEWDTAAGQCILEAAGGANGGPIRCLITLQYPYKLRKSKFLCIL